MMWWRRRSTMPRTFSFSMRITTLLMGRRSLTDITGGTSPRAHSASMPPMRENGTSWSISVVAQVWYVLPFESSPVPWLREEARVARKKDSPPVPVVRVAPLGELKAYTVSEHELDKLESGSSVSDLLT